MASMNYELNGTRESIHDILEDFMYVCGYDLNEAPVDEQHTWLQEYRKLEDMDLKVGKMYHIKLRKGAVYDTEMVLEPVQESQSGEVVTRVKINADDPARYISLLDETIKDKTTAIDV